MTCPSRNFTLPIPGDLRTCSRWSCLKRQPAAGPDPAALFQLVEATVHTVAARIVLDTELAKSPQPADTYEGLYLDRFWAGVELLAEPKHPLSHLAEAEFRGLLCLEQLQNVLLPRFVAAEDLLLVNHAFQVPVPDGQSGEVVFQDRLARVSRDRETGTIKLYQWRTDDPFRMDWNPAERMEKTGLAMKVLAGRYPGHALTSVQVFLTGDVTQELSWSLEHFRGIDLMLSAKAMLIAAKGRHPLGPTPAWAARN